MESVVVPLAWRIMGHHTYEETDPSENITFLQTKYAGGKHKIKVKYFGNTG